MTIPLTTCPRRLNYYAFATNDMVQTHEFWTKAMRCKFLGAQRQDGHADKYGRSLGRFLHCFYGLADGSAVAVFELGKPFERKEDGVPNFTKHLALSVGSREQLREWIEHFKSLGIPVRGEIDHDGIWYSIYVVDPNGQNVELTWQSREFNDADAKEGEEVMSQWRKDKDAGLIE